MSRQHWNVYVLACFALFWASATSKNALKRAKFDRLSGTCQEYPDTPSYLDDIEIIEEKFSYGLKLKLKITEPVSNNLKLAIIIHRCANKNTDLHKCQPLPLIHVTKFCDYMENPDTILGPVLNSLEPPLRCPIQQGTYVTQHATLNMTALNYPVDGAYWKVKLQVMDKDQDDRMIFCIRTEGEIVPIPTLEDEQNVEVME